MVIPIVIYLTLRLWKLTKNVSIYFINKNKETMCKTFILVFYVFWNKIYKSVRYKNCSSSRHATPNNYYKLTPTIRTKLIGYIKQFHSN